MKQVQAVFDRLRDAGLTPGNASLGCPNACTLAMHGVVKVQPKPTKIEAVEKFPMQGLKRRSRFDPSWDLRDTIAGLSQTQLYLKPFKDR